MNKIEDISVEETSAPVGAKVLGVNLKEALNYEVTQYLNTLLDRHAVLIFPEQFLEPNEFVRAGEIFGKIMPQQLKKYVLKDHPLVGYNSTKDLPIKDGRLQVRGENYHTDHSNFECPPRATALVAVEIPSSGGDTQFVDTRMAFDCLNEDLKVKATNFSSRHVHQSSKSPRELTKLSSKDLAVIPETTQPLVIKHPTSGRPALYLNTGRMEGIEGLPENEGYELIGTLYEHSIQPQFEYRHRWTKGEMVIWDNRSVMHQANADYDPLEHRYLYRIMIEGPKIERYVPMH
ncbi:MAG: (R)-phenoxypropionate/alpha-ketoglutarate-dioxygenase [Gammaproteobacteria bacterium]|nr:MAG: (R)-phenoxypropionate/alpha-ketoglutarate-dioxygenase [Gammaproteobacteria bacterium]|tara:strand:+ start:851 stop:1720 length:870 start_codon:yes stop_codon:yes gene_type:complete